MRYIDFKIIESVVITELGDKVKQAMRVKFKKEDPAPNDQQINFYLDRWDRYAASFPPESRDITRLNFSQVEKLIDAAEARAQLKGRTTSQPIDTNDDTLYNQNNLTITKGDMREKCIQYGKGYSWCISRPDASNLFYRYRLSKDEPVFYFVFDRDRPKADPWHATVIYVTKEGRYMVATALNTGDREMTWEQISAQQPKVSQLRSLFKPQPVSPQELSDRDTYGKPATDATYAAWSLGEKYKYIQFGNQLGPKKQDVTPDELIGIAAKLKPMYVTFKTLIRLNPSDKRKVRQSQLEAVKKDGRLLKNIGSPTEEMQLAALKNDGLSIRYIKNPTEEMQWAALKQDGRAIEFIKNPTGEMQWAAVKHDSRSIKYIQNPSEEMQMLAIEKAGDALQYIDNPSEKVQWAAIRQPPRYGHVFNSPIKYIQNPSEEMKLAAVQANGYALEHIKNPSERVKLAAVQKDGYALYYIENPSERMKLAAVKSHPGSIRYIKNPSERLQLTAVQKEGYVLSSLIDHKIVPSDAVVLAAIKSSNAGAMQFVKKPSPELQLAAVRQDPGTIDFIYKATPAAVALAAKLKARTT